MNRTQLEHIIRVASRISDDREIVVVGSSAIHALDARLPPIAFRTHDADVYPLNHPERAEDIDGAIGELSQFHLTFGYYAQGVGPETAILPAGWQDRVKRLAVPDADGATALCIDVHDLVLSKYAAGREKDIEFNQAIIRAGLVAKKPLAALLKTMPIDDEHKARIAARIKSDFAVANPGRRRKPRKDAAP
jgi:hypothetical protein